LRSTNVLEGPSPSARIVAGIESGVRINVVAANGDWLEVRSRHGNPPGFIRKEDARLVERAE
jgi:SH3-like domain-containing protein